MKLPIEQVHYLWNEVKVLRIEQEVPQSRVCKRLKLTPDKLGRVVSVIRGIAAPALVPAPRRIRFAKLHQRAKDFINYFLERGPSVITARMVRKALLEEVKLTVSLKLIRCYLKERLNCSYKTVNKAPPRTYFHSSKLQRQFAAAEYIRLLQDHRRIINIDESVLNSTDPRSKGWSKLREKALAVDIERLPNLNIIAGVSNMGEFFFTVNRGKTNSLTFKLYLLRLIQVLTEQDPGWRTKTVLMLDNAPYHRSKLLMNFYKALKLPVMFLGPYQFDMAPVEKFFSYLKGKDLNQKGLNLKGQ